MQIYQILDKIDDNQLFVPAFQREYVWKRDDAKKLMASLIKDYPTGTMLTWDTTNPPELKGVVQYDQRMGSIKLILDGQQRITTLYVIIRGKIPPYYTSEEVKSPPLNLYANVETLELEFFKPTKMENNPVWQNLTDIFQKKVKYKNVIKALNERGEEVSDERDDLIDDNFTAIQKIPDREFLEQTVPIRATIKEAIDIFYIVNASGVNLSDAELALAHISGYWPQARERIKSKLFKMEKDGFAFRLDFMVYVLLGIMHKIGSDMSKLHTEDNKDRLVSVWEQLETRVLDYVMNILRQHIYIDHTKEINSIYALVPVIVYVFNKEKNILSEVEIKKIKKWFYFSQLRQRYVSQTPQKLDKDVGIVTSSDTPFDDLLNIIKLERPLEISSDEFVGRDIRHPLYSLMRWYFKSLEAVCFSSGVGIRQNMGEKYTLEWDHIFPYSVLKDEGGYNPDNRIDYALIQEITNRAIISQTANRSKSNRYAEDYLNWITEHFPGALEKQCIPMDRELWKLENFKDFLVARRQLLTDRLNAFLTGITETEETAVEMSIEDLIAEDESTELEFKSSLRWDYREERVNTDLEKVIIKSLAALNNKDGGILLIGVAENEGYKEAEVLGLEPDYASLKGGNRDKFELHLRHLINQAFGKVFAAKNIAITFPMAGDKEICRIDIKRGTEALFVETMDKHGVRIKRFYVRSGNESVEMSIDEATEYIRKHFNGF